MARAADEGVSLSLLVATLLASAHPFDFRPDDDEAPELQAVVVVDESSPEDDDEPEPPDSKRLESTP